MANSSGKWKSKLLSSSIPLEYDAAKVLVEQSFSTTPDFAYAREDAGVLKDFSVDLYGLAFPPYDPNDLQSHLELLVECKYRHPGTSWLFFPDPNVADLSSFTLGSTLRAMDEFSWAFFERDATVGFDVEADFCFKGVEVNVGTGDVDDSQIRHGLAQLQFALPRLMSDAIRFNAFNHPDDNLPILFCPILLTTAPVLVAHPTVGVAEVSAANALADLAEPVDWVVVGADPGPDFERHRIRQFAKLRKLAKRGAFDKLDEHRRGRGEHDIFLPSTLVRRLSRPGPPLHGYFQQFVVCSMAGFNGLVESVKHVALSATNGLRDLAPKF